MKLEEYVNLFRQNGWEKYLPNLYKCIIDGRDVNELIECIEKLEGLNKDSKPSPKIKYKEAEISYDRQTNELVVKTTESSKIGVSCPSGEEGYLEDDRAGCRTIGNPSSEFLKKEKFKDGI